MIMKKSYVLVGLLVEDYVKRNKASKSKSDGNSRQRQFM